MHRVPPKPKPSRPWGAAAQSQLLKAGYAAMKPLPLGPHPDSEEVKAVKKA